MWKRGPLKKTSGLSKEEQGESYNNRKKKEATNPKRRKSLI